jgi:hypothetical protein
VRELVDERERREHVDDKFCAGKEPALAHDFGLAGAAEHLDDTTVVCALRDRRISFLLVVAHHGLMTRGEKELWFEFLIMKIEPIQQKNA